MEELGEPYQLVRHTRDPSTFRSPPTLDRIHQLGKAPVIEEGTLVMAEYSLPTIKALVGHSRASVTEGYIHKIESALLAAADRIARHIDDAMTGRKANKVVQLRKN